MQERTRRGFFQDITPFLFLPRAQEQEHLSPYKGEVIGSRDGERYLAKEELSSISPNGIPTLRRYDITSFYQQWAENTNHHGTIVPVDPAILPQIPLREVPRATNYEHWNKDTKVHNKFGGFKIIPIPGMGEVAGTESFEYFEKMLATVGVSKNNILPPSYAVDFKKQSLGTNYTREDSTQDPWKSFLYTDLQMYLWKTLYPLEKFWLVGHSQGGWLAYELAKKHFDCVAGVITLDGAIKGADVVESLPSTIERLGARIFGGEAGAFFIERGSKRGISDEAEREVATLVKNGMVFICFSSTDDPIVSPPYSNVLSSTRQIAGRKLNQTFSMGSDSNWEPSQHLPEEVVCTLPEINCLSIDLSSPSSQNSAQLRQRVGRYTGLHGAPLFYPDVLNTSRFALIHNISNEKIRKNKDAVRRFKQNGALHDGDYYTMGYDFELDEIYILVYSGSGPERFEKELKEDLKKRNIDDIFWLTDLENVSFNFLRR